MNKYWSSIDEINGAISEEDSQDNHKESVWKFVEDGGGKNTASRRDFLKLCGFTLATAALASSCENPVNKAVPLLNRPEELVPGKAAYYAGSIINGPDYCPVVVKVRDGRPIKIEGNELSDFSGGGTFAKHQASVLSLYDNASRYKSAIKNSLSVEWEECDKEIKRELEKAAEKDEKVVLLTSSVYSPSTQKVIKLFTEKYPNIAHITYDAISASGILEANNKNFGISAIPTYHFDNAELIVSVNADFLGAWLSPLEYTADYSRKRKPDSNNPTMSRHIQIESWLSLSGAAADLRIGIKPSEVDRIIYEMMRYIRAAKNNSVNTSHFPNEEYRKIADELLTFKGKSLLICGSNNPNTQEMVNAINYYLGNYGETIDIHMPNMLKQGIDSEFLKFVEQMKSGKVSGVIFYACNPLYDSAQNTDFAKGMKELKWSISLASSLDETAEECTWICPDHHPLESWNDAMPVAGFFSIAQACLRPLYNTRQFQDSLLVWSGHDISFMELIREEWEKNIFHLQDREPFFENFWNQSLGDGVFVNRQPPLTALLNADFSGIKTPPASESNKLELIVYESITLGVGNQSNNPWLLELPDPILKISWDNALLVGSSTAGEYELKTGDYIEIGEESYPLLIQPGIPDNVFAIATGYGRTKAGKAGNNIGKNAFVFIKAFNNNFQFHTPVQSFRKTGIKHDFAFSQRHSSMEGRSIVRESTLEKYRLNRKAGNEERDAILKHLVSLYPPFEFPGHHWGLAIDLNACTGCSNCVIACQAENNIPTVGKDMVKNTRIMHWMRIDRYFSGTPENPQVLFQPIMCMQCDNAPCENVCPVSATMHSDEGISQMAYNRCVGTRYCINNCPYKQRRFNWVQFSQNNKFDYHMNSDIGRLVLNPDITVRERGVVEKCSFCIQRIQEKKLEAKLEGRQLREGEILPACMQSCPSKAIVFGDLSDTESRVSKLFANERNYHLLEELHTLPSVGYLTRIRNCREDDIKV